MSGFRIAGHQFGGVPRDYWRRQNAALDPERDYAEIYRNIAQFEFPWEILQSLSLALFRTFAVPTIGELLDRTQEFQRHTQKRYDDTTLLLEQPTTTGFDTDASRTAIRRINQMHRSYDISNDDLRYVLSTFVVVPIRWIADYGKRPLDPGELAASVAFYQHLGRMMGIKDIPTDYSEFATLMDDYEAVHFQTTPASRRVADATLELLTSFYPRSLTPLVRAAARAMMDPPLLAALGYPRPPPTFNRATRAALVARGRLLRLFPARRTAALVENHHRMRSYPSGFVLQELGTFPEPDQ
jgi:hypothetical protein